MPKTLLRFSIKAIKLVDQYSYNFKALHRSIRARIDQRNPPTLRLTYGTNPNTNQLPNHLPAT